MGGRKFECAFPLVPACLLFLLVIETRTDVRTQLLNHQHLPSVLSLRRWLLEKTAHLALGGFGKLAGDLPDIYHSCLGLAALSLMGDEDLKPLDAAMCISKEAKSRLNDIWKRWGVDEVVGDA